jgi:hypothetical protein
VKQVHENHRGIEQKIQVILSLILQSNCLQVHDLHLQKIMTASTIAFCFTSDWFNMFLYIGYRNNSWQVR